MAGGVSASVSGGGEGERVVGRGAGAGVMASAELEAGLPASRWVDDEDEEDWNGGEGYDERDPDLGFVYAAEASVREVGGGVDLGKTAYRPEAALASKAGSWAGDDLEAERAREEAEKRAEERERMKFLRTDRERRESRPQPLLATTLKKSLAGRLANAQAYDAELTAAESAADAQYEDMDWPALRRLFTAPECLKAYERHGAALLRIIRMYPDGLWIKSLVEVEFLLGRIRDILEDAMQSGHAKATEAELIPALAAFFHHLELPFRKRRVTDEGLAERTVIKVMAHLGELVCNDVLPPGVQAIAAAALESVAVGGRPAKGKPKVTPATRVRALDLFGRCHATPDLVSHFRAVVTAHGSAMAAGDVAGAAKLAEVRLALLRVLRTTNVMRKDATLQCKGGLFSSLAICFASWTPPTGTGKTVPRILPVLIECLWNLLENSDWPLSHADHGTSSHAVIAALAPVLDHLLRLGVSQEDRELRNDLLTVISIMSRDSESVRDMKESALADIILSYAVMPERPAGSSRRPNAVHDQYPVNGQVYTREPVDFQMKQLMFDIASNLLASLGPEDQNTNSGGFECYYERAINGGYLDAVLHHLQGPPVPLGNKVHPPELTLTTDLMPISEVGKKKAMRMWTQPQSRDLQLQALGILVHVLPVCPAAFQARSGTHLLLKFIDSICRLAVDDPIEGLDADMLGDAVRVVRLMTTLLIRTSPAWILKLSAGSTGFMEFEESLGDNGAIELLLNIASQTAGATYETRVDAVTALARVCQNNPANQTQLKMAGGVQWLTANIRIHQKDPTIPAYLCLAILLCISCAVVENKVNRAIMVAGGGVDLLLELLESGPTYVRPSVLVVLSDVAHFGGDKLSPFLFEWQSKRDGRTAVDLFVDLWKEEEERLGLVRRSVTGLPNPDCLDGTIANADHPLVGDKTLARMQPPAGVLEGLRLETRWMSLNHLKKTVEESDLLLKLYGICRALRLLDRSSWLDTAPGLGSSTSTEDLHDKFAVSCLRAWEVVQKGLTFERRVHLRAMRAYLTILQKNVWEDMMKSLAKEGVEPVDRDLEIVTQRIQGLQDTIKYTIGEQKEDRRQESKQQAEQEKSVYQDILNMQKADEEAMRYKATARTVTLSERKAFKAAKEDMLVRAFMPELLTEEELLGVEIEQRRAYCEAHGIEEPDARRERLAAEAEAAAKAAEDVRLEQVVLQACRVSSGKLLRQIFKIIDVNDSGSLTKDEIQYCSLAEQLGDMLDELDEDGDGKVTLREWNRYFVGKYRSMGREKFQLWMEELAYAGDIDVTDEQGLEVILRIFDSIDTDSSGTMSREELASSSFSSSFHFGDQSITLVSSRHKGSNFAYNYDGKELSRDGWLELFHEIRRALGADELCNVLVDLVRAAQLKSDILGIVT